MSGLQIHGRVQVDITDDDHIHYTTKYSYKFEKMLAKSLKNKKGNRRLLLRSGATCIVPGLTLNFEARISVGSLHDLWWASKYFAKSKIFVILE